MTTTTPSTTSVSTSIDVQVSVERAFHVFTERMGTWWDADKHILQAELAEMVFEPWVGGHIIDRGVDGSECPWATILAFDPPNRVCFSWNITPSWQLETDPAKTSEVEITFTALAPDRTHVVLTHRHLERHGEGWEGMRDAVGSGWSLAGFASFAEQASDAGPAAAPSAPSRELGVIRYAVVQAQAGRLTEVYPRHRRYLDAFAKSGDLLLIGTLEEPIANGSLAVFAGKAAAERFVRDDPFVLEGLVEPTVLAWEALDFAPAAR